MFSLKPGDTVSAIGPSRLSPQATQKEMVYIGGGSAWRRCGASVAPV